MDYEILKEQTKKLIDKADEKTLKMVFAMLEVNDSYDFWDALPQYVKEDVITAQQQSLRGEGVPHAEVMKKYMK